jgi:predicted PurR-regulated permease PerM
MPKSHYRSLFWFAVFLAVVGFFVWFFLKLVIFLVVSAVLSLLGKPIMEFICKFRIGRYQISRAFSALFTLLLMIGFLVSLFTFMLPLIVKQAMLVSDLSIQTISASLEEPLMNLEGFFHESGILAADQTLSGKIIAELSSFVAFEGFSGVFGTVIGFVIQVIIGFMVISFVTFFFLKEDHLFSSGILFFTPLPYKEEVKTILLESKDLLRRYFAGLVTDLFSVFLLISFCMWLLGLENALVIGFFAGVLNIIPYVGPIIATFVGVFLGISINLEMDFYSQMLPLIIKIVGSFIIVNTIDVFVLQPAIYSKSVRSHPLEIFIVFIVAGMLGGVFGMIIAIPGYSVFRIFVKVFFEKSAAVKQILKDMKL